MTELIAQQLLNGLTQGMAYALVALGLTMIFGVLHVINFAHGEFYMLGGLAAVLGVTTAGLPYALAIALAVVTVSIVAWLVDRIAVAPVLDTRDGPATVLLTTFAVSLLIHQAVLQSWGPAPGRIDGLPGAISFGSIVLGYQRLLVLVAGIALLAGIEFVLRRMAIGRKVRAIAQSAYAAQVVGIDIITVRRVTFIAAAALAGLTGALLVPVTLFSPAMGQHVIINAFVIVVIGGMGSPIGAVVCGLLLGVLEALASTVVPQEIGTAIIYALLLAALLVRPQGLFGSVRT
ncbi:branched-chain amino acid ABC transporter permease [Roseiarcaceae bacterium H3SJ34-1]|uniref:branched-chain amino acid ABC transporter permease n=1 Tax=Terripilifer ovatus TaxID=3032367 RepID=UPI003AB94EFC|nr:branched-chain amino acid ABC transporter permease [Roseiarcaceae bacterium H3SJ34-1]